MKMRCKRPTDSPYFFRPGIETLETRRLLAGGVLEAGALDPEGEDQAPPQPIVLLPGILGSLPEEHVADWLVFDDEAMHPENLRVDPVKRTYDDLLASLIAAGYNDGSQAGMQTLWAAPYDWRLPVAPRDNVADGRIEASHVDPTDMDWEFGIEYLDYWIGEARTEWESWKLDPALFTVDVVAHSMGGLVARSYIQSDMYDGGEIDQLLMLGTPNHGAVDAYQVREWVNTALELAPDLAADAVATGLVETGPVGALAGTVLTTGAYLLSSPDIETYSPSITDLLPTFDFISHIWPHKWLQGIEDNSLLADLNSSYDYPAVGVDAKVLFGTGTRTDYELYHPLGADLLNLWSYDDLPAGDGDGTVLATSARLTGVADVALDSVEHIRLAGADVRAQQKIFECLDIPAPARGYATGAYRSLGKGIADWASQELKVVFAGKDPVEFVHRHWSEHKPIARGDNYTLSDDKAIDITARSGVLGNDSDDDGQILSVQLVDPPVHGELALKADGGFSYTADASFEGEDSFRYRASDGLEVSDVATVTLTLDIHYPWHNGSKRSDVNGDGHVSPIDALSVIVTLNRHGARLLSTQRVHPLAAPFYDVNRDGRVTVIDALLAIQDINSASSGDAEGETAAELELAASSELVSTSLHATIPIPGAVERPVYLPRLQEEIVELLAVRTGFGTRSSVDRSRIWSEWEMDPAGLELEEFLEAL